MSYAALLAEGFESALLACSLILLVPGAAVGLTARAAAIPALSSFAIGVLTLSWLRFSERGGDHPALLVAAALMLAYFIGVKLGPFVATPPNLRVGATVGLRWGFQVALFLSAVVSFGGMESLLAGAVYWTAICVAEWTGLTEAELFHEEIPETA